MSDFDFSLDKFNEFQNRFQKVLKSYPNLAEEKLEEISSDFKRRVIALTKEAVKTNTDSMTKGFKLEKVKRNGNNMEQNFISTSPEFQLVENGHNKFSEDGKIVGWIPGKQIVKQAVDEYQNNMFRLAGELLEDILKECGMND